MTTAAAATTPTDPRAQRAEDLLDQAPACRSCWPGAAVDVIEELARSVVELAAELAERQ